MKTKILKITTVAFAATLMFWFWFPRHWRLMQHIGAVIETYETPTTNE